MSNIGIMGGTFDPIHNGHLLLGKQAYLEYNLDYIWFMPSGQPPHKKNRHVTDSVHRCAMVKLALQGESTFLFSDFEVSRKGNTYTAQTLALLKEAYPYHYFYNIIGADSLYEIESWYHPKEVLSNIPLLVADREYSKTHQSLHTQIEYLTNRYRANIQLLHCREMDISSEDIRQAVKNKKSIENEVPAAVRAYIESHSLYYREEE